MRETLKKQEIIMSKDKRKTDEGKDNDDDDKLKEFLVP